MALKNYRSEMSVSNILASIQTTLVAHGARHISYEFDATGKTTGLSFIASTPKGLVTIKLPARIENVAKLLRDQGVRNPDQPHRTAWKNLHDWVTAQMALLECEMVKLEEIFLPYIVTHSGETMFEELEKRQFRLEGTRSSGGPVEGTVIEAESLVGGNR